VLVSSPAAAFCERNPVTCLIPLGPELAEQRACASGGCPPQWFDVRKPALMVMDADGAAVAAAQKVEIKQRGGRAYRPLKPAEILRAGDVVRLGPGAVFEAARGRTRFTTPKGGLPSKFDGHQRPIDQELMDAAERGRSVSVAALLDRGANREARNKFGETPLMVAAAAGHADVVDLLLRRGAELEAEDARGFNAADVAASLKREAVVSALTKRGLPAKGQKELAQAPAKVEEPWVVLVAGDPPPAAAQGPMTPWTAWQLTQKGVLGSNGKDPAPDPKDRPRARFIHHGGEAPRTPQEANEALRVYREQGFAKEHPQLAK